MPKNTRNGFYWFMQDILADLRREGRVFNGMQDVVPVAHPRWKMLSPEERQRYDDIAKKEKAKDNVDPNVNASPEHKNKNKVRGRMDNVGNIIAFREDPVEQYIEEKKKERKLVKSRWPSGAAGMLSEKFYIIEFEYLCKTEQGEYLPCEVGFVEYSMAEGITKEFHRFINPGSIPIGYRFECKQRSEDFHRIPETEFELATSNYRGLWIQIENFVNPDGKLTEYPPLYCTRKAHPVVEYSVAWLHSHACVGMVNRLTKVYELNGLLEDLFDHVGKSVSYSMATDLLATSVFDYERNVACKWHEDQECRYCALGYVKKYGFAMSDGLSEAYNFDLTPSHVPQKEVPLFTVVQRSRPAPSVNSAPRGRGSYDINNTPDKAGGFPMSEGSFASRDIRYTASGFGQSQGSTGGSRSFGQRLNLENLSLNDDEEFPSVVRQPKTSSIAAGMTAKFMTKPGQGSGSGSGSSWGPQSQSVISAKAQDQQSSKVQPRPASPTINIQDDDEFPSLGGAQSKSEPVWPPLAGKFAGRAAPPPASEAPTPPDAWKAITSSAQQSSWETESESSLCSNATYPAQATLRSNTTELERQQLSAVLKGGGRGRGRGILGFINSMPGQGLGLGRGHAVEPGYQPQIQSQTNNTKPPWGIAPAPAPLSNDQFDD